MRNHTTRETYYALCSRQNTDILVSMDLFKDNGSVDVCGDPEKAFTVTDPNRLFFMLEEYSNRFKGDYAVIKIEEVTRTEYTISTTTDEKKKFQQSR